MLKITVRGGTLSQPEIDAYIYYTKKKYGTSLPEDLEIILEVDGEYVNISYNPPIRFHAYRATDYLVNDISKLNASKLAEHQSKVKHTV